MGHSGLFVSPAGPRGRRGIQGHTWPSLPHCRPGKPVNTAHLSGHSAFPSLEPTVAESVGVLFPAEQIRAAPPGSTGVSEHPGAQAIHPEIAPTILHSTQRQSWGSRPS